jgi:flagellar protein FliS
MERQDAIAAYRAAKYESAPPIKLVRMMYEGALLFLAQARNVDARVEPLAFLRHLDQAAAVVEELRLCLDSAHAPDLVEKLSALYLFVEERIQTARAERSAEPLSAAERVLTTLYEGWAGIDLDASRPEPV